MTSESYETGLKEGRRPVWLPWTAGSHERTGGPVLVSLTEFRAHAWSDLPGMAWIGLGLRAGWYGLPGAVGLYLWTDIPRRCVGSLSVWTDAADLRRWIGLPRHVQVMRRYRPRGTARSTQWTCETFDRPAILADAKRRLGNGELSRGTARGTYPSELGRGAYSYTAVRSRGGAGLIAGNYVYRVRTGHGCHARGFTATIQRAIWERSAFKDGIAPTAGSG